MFIRTSALLTTNVWAQPHSSFLRATALPKHLPFKETFSPLPVHILSADGSIQVDRLWAAVHNLVCGRAIAVGLASSAVEQLAAVAGSQDVALVGEGVAPLCAQLVWTGMLALGAGKLGRLWLHTVGVVWGAREGVAEEQRAGQSLGLGDLDGLQLGVSFCFCNIKVWGMGLTEPDLRKSSEKDWPGATVVRGPVALPS